MSRCSSELDFHSQYTTSTHDNVVSILSRFDRKESEITQNEHRVVTQIRHKKNSVLLQLEHLRRLQKEQTSSSWSMAEEFQRLESSVKDLDKDLDMVARMMQQSRDHLNAQKSIEFQKLSKQGESNGKKRHSSLDIQIITTAPSIECPLPASTSDPNITEACDESSSKNEFLSVGKSKKKSSTKAKISDFFTSFGQRHNRTKSTDYLGKQPAEGVEVNHNVARSGGEKTKLVPSVTRVQSMTIPNHNRSRSLDFLSSSNGQYSKPLTRINRGNGGSVKTEVSEETLRVIEDFEAYIISYLTQSKSTINTQVVRYRERLIE